MTKIKGQKPQNTGNVNNNNKPPKTDKKKPKKNTPAANNKPKADAAKTAAANSAAKAAGAKAKEKAKPGEKVKVKGNQVITTKKDGTKVTKTYRANGTVKEKETVTGKGNNKTTTTVKYNKDGKRTEKKVVSGTGKNEVTKTTTYDPATGKRTSKTITTKEPSTTTINYDKDGNPTDKTIKDTTGTTKITYEYEKGNLKSKTETYTDNDNETTTKTTSYSNVKTDKDGRVTSRTATVVEKGPDGKEVKYTVEQTFDYKADGSVTKTYKRKNENGSTRETVKNYDKDGHLTSTNVKAYRADGTLKYEQKTGNYDYSTANSVQYDNYETWYEEDGKTVKETSTDKITEGAVEQEAQGVPKSHQAAAEKAEQLKKKYPDAKITQNDNKVTIEYKDGKVETRTYDKNGTMTKKSVTTGTGDKKKTVTTEFDKDGNPKTIETKYADGTKITKSNVDIEGYWGSGQPTTRTSNVTEIGPDGKQKTYKLVEKNKIWDNGNLKEKILIKYKHGKVIEQTVIQYDKNGKETSRKTEEMQEVNK